ncbi:MAG TPA: hypothetical protein P5179_09345 [Candidatus Latescibacteria bacterium]|nr:hypothetical protein [Candidatus Latescibacterota bacterium]
MKLFAALTGASIALAAGILSWWSAAILSILRWVPLTDSTIAWAACSGLAAGVFLAWVWYRRNAGRVFSIPMGHLAVLYVIWSVFSFAFFMGFPFGAFLLGWLAAVYLGRRAAYERHGVECGVRKQVRFIGFVLGVECLAAGFFGALGDPHTWRVVLSLFGAEMLAGSGILSLLTVIGVCAVLVSVQIAVAGWIAGRASRWGS